MILGSIESKLMVADPIDRDVATAVADRLRIFAQPQRLGILTALIHGELSVSAINDATGIGQPALSQQLGDLRRAGIVIQRRVAKNVVYRIVDARTAAIVRLLIIAFSGDAPLSIEQPTSAQAPVVRCAGSAARFAVVDAG